MEDFTYKFTAIRGVQSDRLFYLATVSFRALASILKLDDHHDVNKRSQRLLDKTRAKKVRSYLTTNTLNNGFYVIPPLVGFIEGDFEFEDVPLDGWFNAGRLVVPIESKIMLFDGQHRAFGIREAMAILPELGMQNISIMFFEGLSLSERKQAFHDINYTQKAPASSLCIAYNERNTFDRKVIDMINRSCIRHLIEYEKNTTSGANPNIYSLKCVRDYVVYAIGKEPTETDFSKLYIFTEALFEVVNINAHLSSIELQNSQLDQKNFIPAKQYRQDFIVGHGVTLKAFGLLAKYFLENIEPQRTIEKLAPLNDKALFYRHQEHWIKRCVNEHEKMVNNLLAVRLTYYQLKTICGFDLEEHEREEEIMVGISKFECDERE